MVWAVLLLPLVAAGSPHDGRYVEDAIDAATSAIQSHYGSEAWFPVVATLCTGNASETGGCNMAGLPVTSELPQLESMQIVLGNTSGADHPTVMALFDIPSAKILGQRLSTESWVGDRMAPLPLRNASYVSAAAALAALRTHSNFSSLTSLDLRFPLDPCVTEPVFTFSVPQPGSNPPQEEVEMFVGMLSSRVCTTGVTKQVASPSSCKLDPPHCLNAGPRKSDDDPAAGQCDGNCTRLRVVNGYLAEPSGRTFVGTNWSGVQKLIDGRLGAVGGLPGLDANASTMRELTLEGDYTADVPLRLPSRLYFRLDGQVRGEVTAENQRPNACKDDRCALVEIGPGTSFVSITGGNYLCEGGTAYGISCQACGGNVLIQDLNASSCGQGNIHFYAAGPAVEIKNVESSLSNRGVWSQTPSRKVLIQDSHFHHNVADGIDLDSMSQNVMIRRNLLEHNNRCGVFIEEGARSNILIDNRMANNSFGIGFFTNLGGKDPGEFPTADHWVVGNELLDNGAAISIGGLPGNGATDNMFAENTIRGNANSWIVCSVLHNHTDCLAAPSNGALVGNHVLTSDTDDARSDRLLNYSAGNITYFAEPSPRGRPSKSDDAATTRDAGILYEVWHTPAAHLVHRVQASGATHPLTVEGVIRSDGKHQLADVKTGPAQIVPAGYTAEDVEQMIYNVEPQLGFYCLYRPRPGENATKDTPVCPNIEEVARQHAKWLTDAGFDYVLVDFSNWPVVGRMGQTTVSHNPNESNDVQVLRPLEVLAEEWLKLRAQGIPTPSIAVWPQALVGCPSGKICMGTKADGFNYATCKIVMLSRFAVLSVSLTLKVSLFQGAGSWMSSITTQLTSRLSTVRSTPTGRSC